jgi:hypothetical protein
MTPFQARANSKFVRTAIVRSPRASSMFDATKCIKLCMNRGREFPKQRGQFCKRLYALFMRLSKEFWLKKPMDTALFQ